MRQNETITFPKRAGSKLSRLGKIPHHLPPGADFLLFTNAEKAKPSAVKK